MADQFTLDPLPQTQQATPQFTLDPIGQDGITLDQPKRPTWTGAIVQGPLAGWVQAGGDWAKTIQSLYSKPTAETPDYLKRAPEYAELDKPWDFSLGMPNIPKLIYRTGKGIAQNVPALAAGLGATAATVGLGGGPENPVADVLGTGAGITAFGTVSAMQAFGPYYAEALKATPNDPDGAWDRALEQAAEDGAISAVTYAAFGVKPFASKLRNMLFQGLGVQPGVAVAGAEAKKQLDSGENLTPSEAAGAALESIPGTLAFGTRGMEQMGRRPVAPAEAPPEPPTNLTPDMARPARPPEPILLDRLSSTPARPPAGVADPFADLLPANTVAENKPPIAAKSAENPAQIPDWAATVKPSAGIPDPFADLLPAKPATVPERLAQAAIRVNDTIYTGQTHGDAAQKAFDAGVPESVLGNAPSSDIDGFVTSIGRYVSRAEASKIAKMANQPNAGVTGAEKFAQGPLSDAQWQKFGELPQVGERFATDLTPGAVVGVKGLGEEPIRATIRSVKDGIVEWANDAGQIVHDDLALFKKDLAPLPEVARTQENVAPIERQLGDLGLPGGKPPEPARELTPEEVSQRLAAPPEPKIELPQPAPEAPSFDVYHGSPHTFDQFSAEKIGTGEGAQAYGHGLYFAEHPDVAKNFARMIPQDVSGLLTPEEAAQVQQIDKARASLEQQSASLGPQDRQRLIDLNNQRTAIQQTALDRQPEGNIYKAQIAGAPESYLDWAAPISQQPLAVQAVAAELIPPTRQTPTEMATTPSGARNLARRQQPTISPATTGKDIYAAAVQKTGSPEAASAYLAERGVPGNRYFDQGSRETGEGTRNYVVFNPEHITATERNGKILPGASGDKVATEPAAVEDGINAAHRTFGAMFADESGAVGTPKAREAALKAADVLRNVLDTSDKDPLNYTNMGRRARYMALAQTIASEDRASARYLGAIREQDAAVHTLQHSGATAAADYLRMSDAERAPIDKYFEYMTMTGMDREPTGRPIVFRADPEAFGDRQWPLQLTKPGETVRLTPKQTAAAEKIQGFLADAWKKLAEANARRFDYDGPMLKNDAQGRLQFDMPALEAAIANAPDAGARKAAERARGFAIEAQNSGRGASYFPLARYGDWRITVTPKAPKSGTGHPLKDEGTYVHVDSRGPFDALTGGFFDRGRGVPDRVKEEIARLKKQYPDSEFDYSIGQVPPRKFEHVDMEQLDRLLEDIDLRDADGKLLSEAVKDKLYAERLASFRKPRENVPGYSTDFPRAISDYIRSWSNVTGRMLHGNNLDAAYEGTQKHKSPNIRSYWEAHKRYNDTAEHVGFGLAKRVAFLNYLWMRPVSAAIQLMQTPVVTASQHAALVGPVRAEAVANHALIQVLAATRVGRKGLEIDVSRIPGVSDAERAGLIQADREGRFNPQLPTDLAGSQLIRSANLRKLAAPASRVYDIGASGFNTADRANRIAAWLASYRIAQNPAAQAKAAKVYARDASFQESVGATGKFDPAKFANWMTDETQFLSGRQGSSPLMRGWGSLAFQFQHYNANMLRLLRKNMLKMGPEGKAAGLMMIGSVLGASGLMGLPFASDAEKFAEGMYKLATGIEPRFDAKMRDLIANSDWGRTAWNWMGIDPLIGAEGVTEGPSRSVVGMDLGRRVGLGNLLPGDADIINSIPLLAATVGKGKEFAQRWQSGQKLGAMASLLPNAFQDPLKAFGVYPEEGVSTRTGSLTKLPSQVTTGEKLVRALGATPAGLARAQEKSRDLEAIANATKQAAQNQLTSIAREYTLAMDASRSGDQAAYQRHVANAEQVIRDNAEQLSDPTIPLWQKIPPTTAAQIRNRIFYYLSPEWAAIKRASPMKRPEMMQSPYPD